MLVTKECLDMIMKFEGLMTTAYWDGDGYSIGYGHHGADVQKDDYTTPEHAYKMLIDDVLRFEKHVDSYNHIYNWTQNEFDALVCFAYNIGNIDDLTQNGTRDKETIAKYMLEYVHFNGERNDGLVARRQSEHDLFISDCETLANPTKTEYTEDTTIREIVDDVINGKYGNGDDRKESIYNMVQNFVNARY